jgi:Mrp family chromosome partitioning ATPase
VVLVDSPPLLPVTDAAAMAPATDGAILVCRFKKTTREQVGRGAAALAAVSVPLLGTVFTMVPRSGSRAYARYNAYYYPAGRPPTVATRVLPANRAAADADRILEAHPSEGSRRP